MANSETSRPHGARAKNEAETGTGGRLVSLFPLLRVGQSEIFQIE